MIRLEKLIALSKQLQFLDSHHDRDQVFFLLQEMMVAIEDILDNTEA